MPNILIVDFEELPKIKSDNLSTDEEPKCIQDLKNHPIITDPAFSLFRDYVKHNQAAIFEQKYFYANWKQNEKLNDWEYEN